MVVKAEHAGKIRAKKLKAKRITNKGHLVIDEITFDLQTKIQALLGLALKIRTDTIFGDKMPSDFHRLCSHRNEEAKIYTNEDMGVKRITKLPQEYTYTLPCL